MVYNENYPYLPVYRQKNTSNITTTMQYSIKLQREVSQKQPNCKKSVAPQRAIVKKDVKSKEMAAVVD